MSVVPSPSLTAAKLKPRRCLHCRDWIEPQRLVLHPDADDCRECHDELKRRTRR